MAQLTMVTVEPKEVEGHFASRKKRAEHGRGTSTTTTPSNQFTVKCSVRGHHVYKHIWSPCVGKPFETFCEEDNKHNKYVMAVHLNNCLTAVGHIPR